MTTRRSVLIGLPLAIASYSAAFGKSVSRPPVGAIRWDAWYAPGSQQTEAMSQTLGDPLFAGRIPSFGKRCSKDRACFPVISQSQIDHEIDLAVRAGLDFWAFVAYEKGHPIRGAFDRYLASSRHSRLKFSLICDAGRFLANRSLVEEHISLLAHPSWQKSINGKPMYSVMITSGGRSGMGDLRRLKSQIAAFRAGARSRLALDVDVIALLAPGVDRAGLVDAGFDAIGYYSIVCSRSGTEFKDLSGCVQSTWVRASTGGRAFVPTIMMGWDRSPRMKHPVPWERRNGQTEIAFQAPSAMELKFHIESGLEFAKRTPNTPAILIYAWNEFDEGGWIYPASEDNFDRIEVLKSVLQK